MAFNRVKEKLASFYADLEAKYYSLMDWLEEKGFKPYEFFVNPIESRGIPSFPVFVMLLLLTLCILGFALYSLFFTPAGKALVVSVNGVNGKNVDGASVVVFDGTAKLFENATVGGRTAFSGLPAKLLSLSVSKAGFKTAKKNLDLSTTSEIEFVKIVLACESAACEEQYGNATKREIAFEENAQLIIGVSDSSTGAGVAARVSVYDAVSNVLMTEVSAVGGVAVAGGLEIGMQVYLKAEADGYLAFDGSKNARTLEAGKNDFEIKMVPLVDNGCAKGSSVSCVTEDGYAGTKKCGSGNSYGECVATPNYCAVGTKVTCTTEDACVGAMTCGSNKLYGDCIKTVSSCSGSCTPGDEIACTTREGFQGTMSCGSNKRYGECKRIPIECTPGKMIACTANNACPGNQQCGSNKRWGSCTPTDPSCSGGNYASSKIVVVNSEDETPIASALVSVYTLGSSTPLIKDKMTDKNGSVVFNLSTENVSSYFAVASKTGFFEEYSTVFIPGENVEISIEKKTPENSANLSVRVIDVDANPVSYALVALFRKSAEQPEIVFKTRAEKATGEDGTLQFQELKKGTLAVANASLDAQHGTAEKTLGDPVNQLDVQLELPPASITIQATNILTDEVIENAEFKAFFKESELSACASPNCTLAVKGLHQIRVEASAPGFSPSPYSVSVTLRANENAFLNAFLIDDNDINGSIAVPSDPLVVDAETGFEAAALKPGRNYAARFQLVTRENSELEQTGFHFSLEPQGIATINAFKPFAPQSLGGFLDETLGCGDVAAVNASSGLSLAWLDMAFQGARNIPIEVNFSVSLNPALDPATHQGVLSLKARSYAVNNSQYMRNPFDESLSVNPGEVLESGCGAESNYYNYPATSLGYSCSEQACIFVKFIQASSEGFDGFEASDLKDATLLYLSGVKPQANQSAASLLASSNLTQLVVYYSIESFKPLKAYSGMAFEFNETDLKVYNATTPLPPEGFDCKRDAFYTLPSNWTKSNATDAPLDSFKNPLVLDFSRLIECYDYPPIGGPSKQKPYSFGGVLYALPWRAVERSGFKTFFATAESPGAITPEDTTAHETWLKILPSFPVAPSISELTLVLSQTQNGVLNDEGADSTSEYVAEPLNASEPFLPAEETNTSLIFAKFNAALQRNAFDNAFSLEIPDCQPYCRAALKIVGVEYAGINYTRADGTEFETEDGKKIVLSEDYSRAEIRAGNLNQGDEFQASFILAPLSIEVTGFKALSQVVLKHEALDSAGEPLTPTQREPKSVSIRGANVSTISYFAPGVDNCGGAIHVNYNTAAQLLSFQQGCTDLGFRVTPILPADAIFASVNSTVTLLVRPVAGDLNAINCFESCSIDAQGNIGGCTPGFTALTNTGSYALRYNTEATSCPADFKLLGADKLKGAELTVAISAPGMPDEFAKQLKIHVIAENKFKSLYVAPIYASYSLKSDGARESFYPQVWGVFNHKQIGKRDLIVSSEDGELEFAFEGPGAQFFAFSPTSGSEGIQVYEKIASGSRKLVFDSSGNQSDSEYFEAMREDFAKKFGDSEVDCLQTDPECQDYKKQFAEFNSKSKQIADAFLNSLSGNEPFNKTLFLKLREKAEKIANTTAFWRSFQQQLYCRDVDDNGVTCAGRTTDAACCRGSIYDWANVTIRNTFALEQCVFCNNQWRGNPPVSCDQESDEYLPCTNNPVSVFNCDQRCVQTGSGGVATVDDGDSITLGGSQKICQASKYKGIASISDADVSACKTSICPVQLDDSGKPFCYTDSNGDGFIDLNSAEGDSIEPTTLLAGVYSCSGGKKIAVSKECTASCDNWCTGRVECSATCDSNGLNLISTGSKEVLGQMPAGVKLVTVKLDSSDQAYQTYKLLPRRMFPEFGDPQKFVYHYSINTQGFKQGKAVSLKQELGLSEVNGCSEAQKYAEEGSYLITQENVPDVGSGQEEWLAKADVITISRDKYLGKQCLKNDAKWSSVALCAPLYSDNSPLYGSCINNLALLAPELLSMTFFGRLSARAGLFVYPVDAGRVVQGEPTDDAVKRKMRGFFLSERGYAVAFKDSSKTGGWFSGYTITQDFDYWNPLGQKASAKQMVWKTPWYKTGFFKIVLISAATAAIIATTGILTQPMVNVLSKIVPATIMKTGAFLATHLVTGIIVSGALGTMAAVSFWPDSNAVGAAGPCMPGTAKYALIDSFGNDDFGNSDIGVRGCKGTSWQACDKDSCSQETKS